MDNIKKAIGKRVFHLRKMSGLTQENIAEMLNCSVKHVSEAERGSTLFSIEKMMILSDYFNCSLDYLIRGSDSKDITSIIPPSLVEVLRSNDDEESNLLFSYLDMYSRIKKSSSDRK